MLVDLTWFSRGELQLYPSCTISTAHCEQLPRCVRNCFT